MSDSRKHSFPLAGFRLDEPWVDLPDGKALAGWGKDDEVRSEERRVGKECRL